MCVVIRDTRLNVFLDGMCGKLLPPNRATPDGRCSAGVETPPDQLGNELAGLDRSLVRLGLVFKSRTPAEVRNDLDLASGWTAESHRFGSRLVIKRRCHLMLLAVRSAILRLLRCPVDRIEITVSCAPFGQPPHHGRGRGKDDQRAEKNLEDDAALLARQVVQAASDS